MSCPTMLPNVLKLLVVRARPGPDPGQPKLGPGPGPGSGRARRARPAGPRAGPGRANPAYYLVANWGLGQLVQFKVVFSRVLDNAGTRDLLEIDCVCGIKISNSNSNIGIRFSNWCSRPDFEIGFPQSDPKDCLGNQISQYGIEFVILISTVTVSPCQQIEIIRTQMQIPIRESF